MRAFRKLFPSLFKARLGVFYQHEPRPLRFEPLRCRGGAGTPTVSVVTPSYRQARFISKTLDSVLNQGYPELEYFVQDGGSDDGTIPILVKYETLLSGWASEPDNGQADAIRKGFARTRGDIMAWLNSDDLLMPGVIAYAAGFFARHPEVDAIYGNRIVINEQGDMIGRWVLPPHDGDVLSWVDYVPQETLFWRRELYEKVGGIDPSFQFAMDWDLLLRFRDAGANIVHIPRFMGAFRIHQRQKTFEKIHDAGLAEMNLIRTRIHGRTPPYREIHGASRKYMRRHILWDIRHQLANQLPVFQRLREGIVSRRP